VSNSGGDSSDDGGSTSDDGSLTSDDGSSTSDDGSSTSDDGSSTEDSESAVLEGDTELLGTRDSELDSTINDIWYVYSHIHQRARVNWHIAQAQVAFVGTLLR
jgi:hypothetical protein